MTLYPLLSATLAQLKSFVLELVIELGIELETNMILIEYYRYLGGWADPGPINVLTRSCVGDFNELLTNQKGLTTWLLLKKESDI